jgi:hypothetical protein
MALFISYSSQDRSTVDGLTAALRRAQQQVWFDQELGGGDSWWAKILEQIRACDVFVVALSSNWLQSKPSQSELRYAQALNRPILPVRIGDVDSMRVNPLAALQIIDYRNPTVDVGIQLVTAVHSLTAKPQPLPDPLPDEPPVPFGYIMRLGNTLAEKELSPQQQLQLLVELRSGLDEDGDDPSARGDIAQLLRMLRLRHDVTYRTRTEIDNVLAEIEAKNSSSEGLSATSDAKAQAATAPTHQHRPSAGEQPCSQRLDSSRYRRCGIAEAIDDYRRCRPRRRHRNRRGGVVHDPGDEVKTGSESHPEFGEAGLVSARPRRRRHHRERPEHGGRRTNRSAALPQGNAVKPGLPRRVRAHRRCGL